jgi:hypothetical protein
MWRCSICDTYNEADDEICISCDSPFAIFSYSDSVGKMKEDESSESLASKSPTLESEIPFGGFKDSKKHVEISKSEITSSESVSTSDGTSDTTIRGKTKEETTVKESIISGTPTITIDTTKPKKSIFSIMFSKYRKWEMELSFGFYVGTIIFILVLFILIERYHSKLIPSNIDSIEYRNVKNDHQQQK